MKLYALIVAGGSGERMLSPVPKQFLLLGGKPLIMHTLSIFSLYNKDMEIVLILPEEALKTWEKLCDSHAFRIIHSVIPGGETRFHSVKKGLDAVVGEGLVAIHDGVRPLVHPETIDQCFRVAAEKGNAIPATGINESVRLMENGKNMPYDRSRIRIIQTPQVFRIDQIKKAYAQPYQPGFTDDAIVFESTGSQIHLVPGNPENIKITTSADLLFAEAMLKTIPGITG